MAGDRSHKVHMHFDDSAVKGYVEVTQDDYGVCVSVDGHQVVYVDLYYRSRDAMVPSCATDARKGCVALHIGNDYDTGSTLLNLYLTPVGDKTRVGYSSDESLATMRDWINGEQDLEYKAEPPLPSA